MAIIPGQPDPSWGWLPRVANGPFQSWRYPRIASWGIFSRPCGTGSFLEPLPRTTSWAILSRPYGTRFGEVSSHTPSSAPEVRFSNDSPRFIGKPYLTAKALSDRMLYGTAEAVPFVQRVFPRWVWG